MRIEHDDLFEAQEEIDRLRHKVAVLEQAGTDLTTALWALVLAHQPSMASGLKACLDNAEEVVKQYTSEESRAQLTESLKLAKAGVGDGALRA